MLPNLILLLCVAVVALSVRVRPCLAPPGEPGRGAIPSGAEVRRVHRGVARWVEPEAPWLGPRPPPANLARAPRPLRLVAMNGAASA